MSASSEQHARVLILDDNEQRARDLSLVLQCLGQHSVVSDSEHCLQQLAEQQPILLILGKLDDRQGWLNTLEQQWGGAVALLGVADSESLACPYTVLGRLEFPCAAGTLLDLLQRAQLFDRARGSAPEGGATFPGLVGNSAAISRVREMMAKVAASEVTVLISGPSGSGKEVVASNLHEHSPRRYGPFVPVNCGAIPRELLESELFGHEKGAFTGAISARAGRFEIAQGGTLFLDEIGDMPLDMQVKLLRVLQERRFERIGSGVSQEADVRIIAATHKDLEAMIAGGEFREDLYYRLNVFPIDMPALSERCEDVPLLITALTEQMHAEKRGSVSFNAQALDSLCRYAWPGNIRELSNLLERMAILHPGEVVGVAELPEKFRCVPAEADDPGFAQALEQARTSRPAGPSLPEDGLDLKETLLDTEKALIEQALENSRGVVARAAKLLNLRRTTLVEKMRRYGLGGHSSDAV